MWVHQSMGVCHHWSHWTTVNDYSYLHVHTPHTQRSNTNLPNKLVSGKKFFEFTEQHGLNVLIRGCDEV